MKPEDQCGFVDSLVDRRFVGLSQSPGKNGKPPFWILSHEDGYGTYGHIEGGSPDEVISKWMTWKAANPMPVFPAPPSEVPF